MSRGSKNSSLNNCQSTFTHWLTLSLISHLKCLTASPFLPTGRNWVWHCQSTFTHWLTLILSLPGLISSVSLPVHFYALADTGSESDIASPLLPTGWHCSWVSSQVSHFQSTFTHWLTLSLSLTLTVHFYPLAQVSISSNNFQFQVSMSSFNFKFQFQVSKSGFNFKFQFQASIVSFNCKLQF